jgi:hypothetical protein
MFLDWDASHDPRVNQPITNRLRFFLDLFGNDCGSLLARLFILILILLTLLFAELSQYKEYLLRRAMLTGSGASETSAGSSAGPLSSSVACSAEAAAGSSAASA